ncbi:MAG: peptidoglycan DL-endopeptidase CwlO [Acidimicrobiia bacterium]|nr:peptidoglycan DL-endopeptidase CwlO [Acidimicrobiia bacterium]
MPRRTTGRWRWLAAVTALVGLAPLSTVQAQSLDDLRGQAAALQQQLGGLREQVEAHAEEYNRARARADAAQAQVARLTGDLAGTQSTLVLRRQQLTDYAVQAYVQGGDYRAVDGVLAADPSGVDRRLSYLKSASGDRKALVDRLKASQQDLDRKMAVVQEARKAADGEAQQAESARRDAQAGAAKVDALLAGVQGQVADLVRQEEQRAAEAARQAQAQAQAQAAAVQPAQTQNFAPAAVDDSTPAARPVAVAPAASSVAQAALNAAMTQLGVPYVYGGASPGVGFDCSGLIMWAYAQAGRSLPHAADWQRDEMQPISEADLQPGDVVFYGDPPSHDAMYIGNGQIINAPYTGQVVRIQDMYYSSKGMTFGRVN